MLTQYEINGIWFSLLNIWSWTEANQPERFFYSNGKWLTISLKSLQKRVEGLTKQELLFACEQLRRKYPNFHYLENRGSVFYRLQEERPSEPNWAVATEHVRELALEQYSQNSTAVF